MIAKGNGFKYFIDGKEVSYKDLQTKLRLDMTVEIEGLNVYYYSPKKEEYKLDKQYNKNIKDVFIDSLVKDLNKAAGFEWIKMPHAQSDFTLGELCVNSPQKENKTVKMNRLIEEEIERQQKEFKDTDRRKIINYKPSGTIGIEEITDIMTGKKETEGKLNYELDWEFIQQMAERMNQNKGKYEPYNWKKLMDVEKLKQSLFRHVIEIMKGNYSDDSREFGHLESAALNALFINYQLKNLVVSK